MHILNDVNLLQHPDFSYIHDLPLKKLNIKYKNYYLIKIFNKILKTQQVNITENKIKQNVDDQRVLLFYSTRSCSCVTDSLYFYYTARSRQFVFFLCS